MKNLITTLLLITLTTLMGCTQSETGASITRNSGLGVTPGADNSLSSPANSGGNWGQLWTSSQYQEEFNQFGYGLVASSNLTRLSNDPANLGSLGVNWGDSTGVFFTSAKGTSQAIISLKGVSGLRVSDITNASIPYLEVDTANSSLGILVEGSRNYIEIIFPQASSGTISGNYAEVIFSDNYGSVKLSGQVYKNNQNQYLFSGQLEYENRKTYDGRTRDGVVDFIIDACSFFKCLN